MKVLFLGSDVFAKGGIPRYAVYQIKALKEIYGDDNVFVFSLAAYNPENAFEERMKTDYIQGGISFFDKLSFTLKAVSFIKKNKIDLVITDHIQLSIITYFVQKLFAVKYITNVYGIEVWTNVKRRDIIGLKNSDLIIGDCNFVLKYVKKHFDISDSRLKLLHDPVDTNRFKPASKDKELFRKYSIPDDKFVVMTVGRLERNKGFELMIKNMQNLPDEIIYIIVGDGVHRERLQKIVKELSLQRRVFFTFRVPEDDLVPLYNLSDIFVLVSSFGHGEGEGLPLGLIEASACGKPIIGGNQDGSVDAIDEGKNGFIISPDDTEALRQRIMDLYIDENLQMKMGKSGFEKVQREFEFNVFKKTLESILKNITNIFDQRLKDVL